MKKPNKTARLQEEVATLRRKLLENEAHSLWALRNALQGLAKTGGGHMMASAAIVTITGIGGKVLVPPVAISNGLSEESIKALQADVRRSYEYAIEIGLPDAKPQ